MKYTITESKLNQAITEYINQHFDVSDIHWTNPEVYDDNTGDTYDDHNIIEFYIGDYQGADEGCFTWYGCDYFDPNEHMAQKCPFLEIDSKHSYTLSGFFGDIWKEPFKKWFTEQFNLPVHTVSN